jgi:type II secretory pathway pseudopilin PulG
MLGIKRNIRGDTIVEVILCIAIIGQMIVFTYGLARRSLAASVYNSEHIAAMKYAQSQVEALKYRFLHASQAEWLANYSAAGLNFCLDPDSASSSDSNWSPIIQNTAGNLDQLIVSSSDANYKANCTLAGLSGSAKFFINISTNKSNPANPGPTYWITVRWESIASRGVSMSQIYFRIPKTSSVPFALQNLGLQTNVLGFDWFIKSGVS